MKSKKRPNALAIQYIENDIATKLDHDNVINIFAAKRAHGKFLTLHFSFFPHIFSCFKKVVWESEEVAKLCCSGALVFGIMSFRPEIELMRRFATTTYRRVTI